VLFRSPQNPKTPSSKNFRGIKNKDNQLDYK